MGKADERSAARDFVMARLFAARGQLTNATIEIDAIAQLFVDTDEDRSGKTRRELLESIDAALGEAARAVQVAMQEIAEIDPKEGEPELEDEDDDDDEEDDEDEDEED